MEDRRHQASPRGAIAYGLVCGAIGTFIILIALSVNFIGDGLRDAFDPQQNRVRA